ncbi:MAG: hypothetical protein ACOCOR_05840, partial [Prevotella sp.]
KKIAIDNQQVTDGGRVFLNPASATITSEVVDNQHFGRFPVFIPDTFKTTLFSGIGCGVRTM